MAGRKPVSGRGETWGSWLPDLQLASCSLASHSWRPLWVLGKARFRSGEERSLRMPGTPREEAGAGEGALPYPKRVWGHLLGMWEGGGEAGKWEERDWGWEGEGREELRW